MKLRIFFFCLFWSTLSLGGEVFFYGCLFQFGTLPEGADPIPLIASTYQELLDRVGRTGLPTNTLRQLAENPFELKEAGGTDLLTLARHLREFERMLDTKKWNTPELRARLKADLDQRSRVIETERIETPLRLRKNLPLIVPHDAAKITYSRDRTQAASRTSRELYLADIPNRLSQTYPLPKGLFGTPWFTPDGKALIFPVDSNDDATVTLVPLVNGAPDWNSRRQILPKAKFRTLLFTDSPHVAYAISSDSGPQLLRLDLKQETATPIQFAGIVDSSRRYAQGVIPGTATPFVVANILGRVALRYGTPDAQGVVASPKPGPTLGNSHREPESIRFTPDGKKIVWLHRTGLGQEAYVADLDGGNLKQIVPLANLPFAGATQAWIETGPNHEAYVLSPEHETGKTLVRRLDLDLGKEVGSTHVPHIMDEHPTLTSDGRQFLFREAKAKLTVLDIDDLAP